MHESIGFLVHPRHNTITHFQIEMTESLGIVSSDVDVVISEDGMNEDILKCGT